MRKSHFPMFSPRCRPPFRHGCRWLKVLFLLERGCMTLFMFTVIVVSILMLIKSEIQYGFCFIIVIVVTMLLWWVCLLLRHTPKFFWHCPCCGKGFPYYAPPIRGSDELKESDCIQEMEHLRIAYVKPKFCPLVIPSICPECRAKFFVLADHLLGEDMKRKYGHE